MGRREPFDLVIRGGTVVRPGGRTRQDVYVRDGRIVELAGQEADHPAGETVDASGLLVLPGFVDTHVHLMDPGDPSREDFPTGTRAAARAGVTSIIEHTHGWPVTSLERLREKRSHLRDRSWVDYGLAAHAWDDNLGGLAELWGGGVAFVKAFTCETHGVPPMTSDRLLTLFEELARIGGTALVHCEDDLITARNERRLRAAGRDDGGLLHEWRSREAELVAAGSAALLAELTGARITIAHVSSAAVLELLESRASAGSGVSAETCPQYLTLAEDEALDAGALRKFTPPARLRTPTDAARMWQAIDQGRIGVLSSDHAPSTLEQKRSGSIWDVHFGLPGIDTTSSVLLDAALQGHVALESIVTAYAERPARRYGLRGKGRLAAGYDADLVLVDPAGRRTLRDEDVVSRAGWTPYAGRTVAGSIVATFLRGERLAADGVVEDRAPTGRFLPGAGAVPHLAEEGVA